MTEPTHLTALRQKIDAIDDRLLKLISERAATAQEVGHVKVPGSPLYRPEREANILRRMQAANTGPLSSEAVARIFREVISNCMALEQPLVIAFLGPEGTFSHAASIKHFGSAPTFEPCPTIDEAFRMVEATTADYAVVPVVKIGRASLGKEC